MNLRIIFGLIILTATLRTVAQETPESWPSPVKDTLNGINRVKRMMTPFVCDNFAISSILIDGGR